MRQSVVLERRDNQKVKDTTDTEYGSILVGYDQCGKGSGYIRLLIPPSPILTLREGGLKEYDWYINNLYYKYIFLDYKYIINIYISLD